VRLTAAGFSPETEIQLGAGRKDSEYDILATAHTDARGSLTTTLAIPTWAEPEEEWTFVAVTRDGATRGVSGVFQVTQPDYQGTVTISPRSGPSGTRVDTVARGFPPDAAVEIGVGRLNSEYDVVATAQTDANGRVEAEITIPAFVEPEDRWVIVVVAEERPVSAISEEFDVTETPTPSGNLFTRTNIHLIAIDDDGQSGLYNALYRSDLTLQDVVIKNREAVIKLSGALTLGGLCDKPRVRAQLRETALQYAAVDSVSIFVNGTSLGELLEGG
jgi:hypothetical protein